MSTPEYREPTNEQLWAQPPAAQAPDAASQELAPLAGAVPATPPLPPPASAPQQHNDRTVFVLAIVSMALGIPLTAIAASTAGLAGLLVVWVAIVAVNFTYARSRRQH